MMGRARGALVRALLAAMLLFAIDEPPARRLSVTHLAVAELLVHDVPADLIVLDVAARR